MRKSEVKRGAFYAMRHHNDTAYNLSIVQVIGEAVYGNGYELLKLSTGRRIRIKSAAKLRYEVVQNDDGKWVKV